ncbi:unnamed protein product [Closterium sp. Naga37s-1]|nr:unnamed protein product [Closterium sp. Naga37s-1]
MEVRVVQSAATTAKTAESIATSSSDARPTCTQLAAITPPEAAALVPEEDFSDIEETRVGSSHLRVRHCHASLSPLPSLSLIPSHLITPLRCSPPSPPLLVAPSFRLRLPLPHPSLRAYLPLTTLSARTRLCLSAPASRPFASPRSAVTHTVSFCHVVASMIHATQFWEDEGEDVEGRIVVRIVGKYLPAHVFPTDHVERYIHYKLHELFSLAGPDRHVSVLYIHTECESLNDNPLLAFRDIFQGLPPSLQQRVGAVYILHPSLTLRLGLWLLSPWLSDSLYSRMVCVSRVEFLWEHIQEDQVDLPDFCLAHDGKLEAHPLLDYGFQLDRVTAGQHLPVGL